ncbi:chaplin [Streptomyces sp. NPDC048595]|uniref:chaplin n=1 Tax=Streptomyces sp. NPDC048595 TaxID=3365576 RepID=UPI0037116426
MKRFVQAAAMTAASCALVVGGAGIATAGGGSYYGQSAGTQQARHGHGSYAIQQFGRGGHHRHRHHHGHQSGAFAKGYAVGSPGFLSGNLVQVPINIPINVCGNSVNIAALLNPAFGNRCINITK